jgi:hypothetical protein
MEPALCRGNNMSMELNKYAGFEVIKMVAVKRILFWDAMTCYQSAATCSRWFLARGFFYPEDGGDTLPRNVVSHKIYTAPYSRRRYSLVCSHLLTLVPRLQIFLP